jgi:hypothetical protein
MLCHVARGADSAFELAALPTSVRSLGQILEILVLVKLQIQSDHPAISE